MSIMTGHILFITYQLQPYRLRLASAPFGNVFWLWFLRPPLIRSQDHSPYYHALHAEPQDHV